MTKANLQKQSGFTLGVAYCGVNRSRSRKYRRAGTELAVITYEFTNGTTTLVKNF
jgi:hypothetical protein